MSKNAKYVAKSRGKAAERGTTRMDLRLRPGYKTKLAEMARVDGISPTEWLNRRIEYAINGLGC